MWKYLGYIPLVLALIGSIYGGLRIASGLQTTLEVNTQMAEDAHERISTLENNWQFKAEKLEMDTDNALEKLEFSIDNNKSTMTYQVEDFQRELLQLQKIITMLEGTTQALEKKSNDYASYSVVDGLREQIFQVKDSVMQLQNPTDSGINYQQIIFDMQNQIQDINRRIDEHHSGNWN